MVGLIPTENWEYSIGNVISGLFNTFVQNNHDEMLHINGVGKCIPARSGRAAIVAAIKALQLKSGANIGVPLYSCPVVFKAIKETGCLPVFIDIEPDTYNISVKDLSKKSSLLDAIIIIHMFGNVCDISSLLDAANGKPLIEDCAQSLGSKFEDRMTGTFGNIGVYSFRSGKYLSVGEGGALFTSDKEKVYRLLKLISEMPIPFKSEELIHVLKTYIRSKLRSKPMFGIIGKKIWQIYNRTVNYSAKTPIVLRQIFKSDHQLTINRLNFIENAIERQRSNAKIYEDNLQLDSGMLCIEKPGTFYNRFMYPILFSSTEHRDLMAKYLGDRKIDTAMPYQDIPEIATEYYNYNGDCPVTENMSKRILIIPSYYKLGEKEVKYIVSCVNSGWKQINNHVITT